MKLSYEINKQHVGPLVFSSKKILEQWIKVIKERGAINIRIEL